MIQQIAQAPDVASGDGARLLIPADPKVQPRHLARGALIYVRQSHPSQVQRHPESARRQYGLVDRARLLGWPAEQVTVIDDDQGKSAAGSAAAHERDGFARLVSAVGLGEIGIVLALEVSRLARNSAEWYRLLELAALAGVLIADDTTIYDPRLFNDRLLLGLRGTISEVELHCIQERLQGARSSKAQRGELHLRLPAGYVHGSDGRGRPWGSTPTVDTPLADRANTAETTVAPTTATRTAGSRVVRRGRTSSTTSTPTPTATACHTVWSSDSRNILISSKNPSASVENPKSLGSCPTTMVTASPFR